MNELFLNPEDNELSNPEDVEYFVGRIKECVDALRNKPLRESGYPYMEHTKLGSRVARFAGFAHAHYQNNPEQLMSDVQVYPDTAAYVQYAGTNPTMEGMNDLIRDGFPEARTKALVEFLGALSTGKPGDPYVMQLRSDTAVNPVTNEVAGVVQGQSFGLVRNAYGRGLGIRTPLIRKGGGMYSEGIIPLSYMAISSSNTIYTLQLATGEGRVDRMLGDRMITALAKVESNPSMSYDFMSVLDLVEGADRNLSNLLGENQANKAVRTIAKQYAMAEHGTSEDLYLPERMHWLRKQHPEILKEAEAAIRSRVPDPFDLSPQANNARLFLGHKLRLIEAIKAATNDTSFDTIREEAQK